jgi:hypothetical protein
MTKWFDQERQLCIAVIYIRKTTENCWNWGTFCKHKLHRGRRDRMVVGFITIYIIYYTRHSVFTLDCPATNMIMSCIFRTKISSTINKLKRYIYTEMKKELDNRVNCFWLPLHWKGTSIFCRLVLDWPVEIWSHIRDVVRSRSKITTTTKKERKKSKTKQNKTKQSKQTNKQTNIHWISNFDYILVIFYILDCSFIIWNVHFRLETCGESTSVL